MEILKFLISVRFMVILSKKFRNLVGIMMINQKFVFSDIVKMDTDEFIELINKVCNVPEGQPRGTQLSDKCFLYLFFLHEDEGIKSPQLYEEIEYWRSKL